jgi:hypothetical protein
VTPSADVFCTDGDCGAGGTCVAFLADGAACTAGATPRCQFPSTCNRATVGTCTLDYVACP